MNKLTAKTVTKKNGDVVGIEFFKGGEFEIMAEWDERDPQDDDHKQKFKEWAYRLLEQKGYEIE